MSWLSRLFGEKPQATKITGSGEFDLHIVGEGSYQPAIEGVAGPKTRDGAQHACVATLIPEPKNPHDHNAIRVTIGGQTVGYLSRGDAKAYRRELLKAGAKLRPYTCDALIVGGWRKRNGDEGHFGVRLDMQRHG